MKTYKKILALGLFLATLVGLLGFGSGRVQAAPVSNEDFSDAQYIVQAISNNKVATVRVSFGGQNYTFIDENTSDGGNNLKFYGSQGLICNQKNTTDTMGIDVTGGPRQRQGGGTEYSAQITLFHSGDTTKDCIEQSGGGNNIFLPFTTIVLLRQVPAQQPQTGPITFQGNTYSPIPPGNNPTAYYGRGFTTNANNCYNGSVLVLDSPGARTGVAYRVSANPIAGPIAGRTLSSVAPGFPGGDRCYLQDLGQPLTINQDGVAIVDNPPTEDPPDAGDTCEAKWSNPLTWIMCPVFSIAEDFTNYLIEKFEGQLCFKVEESPTSAQSTPINCDATNTEDVKDAWNAIKNIVSALLIIIMLAAIFAQALSIGPIDAYTIRKMLPRLVAAVILIQISFYLFSWMVNLVNDVGRGMDSLLADIFPGNIESLQFLINNANIKAGTQGAVAWLTVLGGIGLAVANLPALIMMLFLATVALLVGLAVLIFRKVLILALLMLAPVALLLWVLPNTERYWKMWWDNFIKLLLMFPIIVVIIEAGRIFAFVAGSTAGGGFIALFLVMVGFFGPLFILPKTYKWGGALMQMAGNTMTNVSKPLNEKGGGALKGWGERRQGAWANKYNPQAGVLSRGFRRLQSGHVLPTERSRRLTIAKGDKWAAERNDEANALVNRSYEQAVANGYKGKTGVEAGKQALVDLAGQDTSGFTGREKDVRNRAAKAAVRQLLDTSSWIEMQNATISQGKNAGKRVSEVNPFRAALISSPQHYSATIGKRSDMAPDVIYSAEEEASRTLGKPISYETAAPGSAEYYELEKHRINTALKRLTPESLQSTHYGLFQDIEKVAKATGDTTLPDALEQRMEDFIRSGTIGVNSVGSLRGGSEGYVNDALALSSRPRTLASFFGQQRAAAAPATTQTTAAPTAGAINIPHGQPPPPPPPTGGQPPAGGGRFNPPPGSTTTGGFSP